MDYDREQLVTDAFQRAVEELRSKTNVTDEQLRTTVGTAIAEELAAAQRSLSTALAKNREEIERAAAEWVRTRQPVRLNVRR